MEVAWIYLLMIAAGVSQTFAREDLQNMSFIFGKKGYVTVESDQEGEPLENVTLCLKHFSELMARQALFSYATKDQSKDIAIHMEAQEPYRWYNVYIGGADVSFRTPYSYLGWQSVCINWASETGVLTFWLNQKALSRKIVRKGYSIRAHTLVELGRAHKENIFFSGEIQDVYLWNYTVEARDMKSTEWKYIYPLPVVNWRNLEYEIQGNVALEYIV
ncbi:serum amyloid P-component isoform X2 [Pogona vitticeps]